MVRVRYIGTLKSKVGEVLEIDFCCFEQIPTLVIPKKVLKGKRGYYYKNTLEPMGDYLLKDILGKI